MLHCIVNKPIVGNKNWQKKPNLALQNLLDSLVVIKFTRLDKTDSLPKNDNDG